jgi:hypothetical protein
MAEKPKGELVRPGARDDAILILIVFFRFLAGLLGFAVLRLLAEVGRLPHQRSGHPCASQ